MEQSPIICTILVNIIEKIDNMNHRSNEHMTEKNKTIWKINRDIFFKRLENNSHHSLLKLNSSFI